MSKKPFVLGEIVITAFVCLSGFRLPIIKRSGSKTTVKVPTSAGAWGNTIRYKTPIDPMKGTRNPPHAHVPVPKKLTR